MKNKKFAKYFREYEWSNISAMIRNNRSGPRICPENFHNKLVVITGATSGIGYHTAIKYASHGANLLFINRNEEKSKALCSEIENEFSVKCDYRIADLSSLKDIFRVAGELADLGTPIDVLIHNAGTYLTKRELTPEGIEKVFAVHYLSSFIMNFILMNKLKSQQKARIILVGSEGHRFAAWGLRIDDLNWEKRRYTGLKSYGSAKLAQLLSMIVFNERFRETGVTINTMHPGAVKTDTGQENGPVYRWYKRNFLDKTLKSPEISAEALYWLGVSKEMENVSGKFFNLTTEEEPAPPARDREVAYELWAKTLEIAGLNDLAGEKPARHSSAESFNKECMSDNNYDTVVVGGGVAGLTATTYLARSGRKVLLIEKNRECGGLVNTFVRNGFHFDAGVRALLDAGIIYPMLKDLNIRLDVVKSPVSLGIEDQIIHIETLANLSEYSELLKKFYPESAGEIDELLKVIRKVIKHMDVLYGIENPFFKDLKRDPGFIFKKLLPWYPRFLMTVRKINRMNAPVEDYLETIIKDNSLRDMISQHFFKNTPSFFALSYFSLYLDYFYPRGGVGKLSEALKNKLLELGGEIKTETRITGVFPEKHFVQDEQGNRYYYKNLVWAADLKTLYRRTETEGLPPETITRIGETKAKMLGSRGGDSVYTLFVEVDEPIESFAKIAHGHFFYTPVRQGLGETHRSELDDLLSNFAKLDQEQILAWLDRFTSLNTYEISIPGLKDPSMAPPGKTGVIISILAEYDLFKMVREAGWLEEFTRELEDRVLRVLSGSVYPMLKDKVIERFSFTPLSIENRAGSSEGGLTGWAFRKEMPVINKIQLAEGAVLTPIPSVYQAGQWVYSPGGVPMSILTGKLAADRVLKNK